MSEYGTTTKNNHLYCKDIEIESVSIGLCHIVKEFF